MMGLQGIINGIRGVKPLSVEQRVPRRTTMGCWYEADSPAGRLVQGLETKLWERGFPVGMRVAPCSRIVDGVNTIGEVGIYVKPAAGALRGAYSTEVTVYLGEGRNARGAVDNVVEVVHYPLVLGHPDAPFLLAFLAFKVSYYSAGAANRDVPYPSAEEILEQVRV